MGIIKLGVYAVFFFLFTFSAISQDSLRLSREQAEAIFLKENLLLIAEKLNISQAEAKVMQAKLWPNPTLEIEEVNLWANSKQLNVFGEELQGFSGGEFGKNQQISLSIEQLVITAGKRKKLIALEQVSVDKSEQYFEDLLRNLKIEFRSQLTLLQYHQLRWEIYQNQLKSINQLTEAYKKQLEQGNVSQREYIRLKAVGLEIAQKINELNIEINQAQKELKLLMRIPATSYIEIEKDGYLKDVEQMKQIVLEDVIEQAKANRPDMKIAALEESYFNNLYKYEKAQRTPDLKLKGAYDRGGNFMYNFIGFGLAIDLPVFGRNQGNIKHAQIGIEQSRVLYQQVESNIENEIVLTYRNLINVVDFFERIEPGYEGTLDELLINYTKNFKERNMGMLEYLDFVDAYLENKEIILKAGRDVNESAEEFNYSVGMDLIK